MHLQVGMTYRRYGAAALCAVVLFGGSAVLLPSGGADADDKIAPDKLATNDDGVNKPESTDAGNGKSSKAGKNPMPAFTPEREAAAVTFVTAHHPELAPLLAGLKLSRPSEYQKAIRKLFGDSERLAHSREIQPRRYELELQEWKLDSRAQLLVARLTMGRTPELEAQLRRVLTEQLNVQRQLMDVERERFAQRAALLEKEIAKLDENRERLLDERFEKAVKSAGQKQPPAKAEKNSK